jgi:hypothetical protein
VATVRGGSDFSTVLAFAEQSPVASNSETTILSYTATANTRLMGVGCSGDVSALWKLYVEGDVIQVKRGDGRNVEFDFVYPLQLLDGETLEVKVTHFKIAETPSFESTLFGR